MKKQVREMVATEVLCRLSDGDVTGRGLSGGHSLWVTVLFPIDLLYHLEHLPLFP